MNKIKKTAVLFIIIFTLLLMVPGQALAASASKLVLGDTFTLGNGEVLDEDLVILGGNVRLEEGSRVTGDIVLLGGNLWVDGTIDGDLVVAGGIVSLQDGAVITGDFSSMGAQVDRNQNAVIEGEIYTNQDIPIDFFPGNWQGTMTMQPGVPGYFNMGWFLMRVVLWGLLAMLLVMFLPTQTERISKAITSQALVAGGLGLGTILIVPIVLIILMITICLIPVSLIGFLVLAAGWAYGMVALGLTLGRRFGRIFNKDWDPALAAGVGTFLLVLFLNGLNAMSVCLSIFPQLIAGAVGLGSVLLTRFGTQDYPEQQLAVEVIEPAAEES